MLYFDTDQFEKFNARAIGGMIMGLISGWRSVRTSSRQVNLMELTTVCSNACQSQLRLNIQSEVFLVRHTVPTGFARGTNNRLVLFFRINLYFV
jgi:hypothetical protein